MEKKRLAESPATPAQDYSKEREIDRVRKYKTSVPILPEGIHSCLFLSRIFFNFSYVYVPIVNWIAISIAKPLLTVQVPVKNVEAIFFASFQSSIFQIYSPHTRLHLSRALQAWVRVTSQGV